MSERIETHDQNVAYWQEQVEYATAQLARAVAMQAEYEAALCADCGEREATTDQDGGDDEVCDECRQRRIERAVDAYCDRMADR